MESATEHGADVDAASSALLGAPSLDQHPTSQTIHRWAVMDPYARAGITNLSLTIIGSFVLALPSTFAEAGWALGLGLLVLFAVLSDLSLVFLVRCSRAAGLGEYEAIGQRLLGAPAAWAVKLSLLTLLFGSISTILIIVSNLVSRVSSQCPDPPSSGGAWYCRSPVLMTVPLLVSLPLAFASTLHALRHTSLVAFGMVLFVLASVVATALSDHSSTDTWPSVPTVVLSQKTVLATPAFALAFSCQFSVVPVYASLPAASKPHIETVIHISVLGIALPIYLAFALVPYLYLGAGVPSNFLTAPQYAGSSHPLITVSQALLAGINVIKMPLTFLPFRDVLCAAIWEGGWASLGRPAGAMVVGSVWVTTYLLALGISNLAHAANLLGCTSGMVLCFVMPSLLYLQAQGKLRRTIPSSIGDDLSALDFVTLSGDGPRAEAPAGASEPRCGNWSGLECVAVAMCAIGIAVGMMGLVETGINWNHMV